MPSINIEDIKKNAEETSKKVEGVKVSLKRWPPKLMSDLMIMISRKISSMPL